MHIVQITPRYYPYVGGIATVVKQVSEELVRMGHKVTVLTIDLSKRFTRNEIINGVNVWRFHKSGVSKYSTFSWGLLRFLKKNLHKYDIIHGHNLHSFVPVIIKFAYKKSAKTHLVFSGHYHGKGKTYLSNFLFCIYKVLFLQKFLLSIDGMVCVSEYEANIASKHFRVGKNIIKVIPNGITIQQNIDSMPKKRNEKNILIVGRLERYKNIDLAIKALPYLPKNYKVKIVGAGPHKRNLVTMIKNMHLDERVDFIGSLSDDELFKLYKTCDLTLNLSELEAFGLTVIESLAAGTPVLVNESGALSELACRFNKVYSINIYNTSSGDLAKKIINCIDMPLLDDDLEEYSWNSIAQSLLRYYQGIKS